jgi:hypothetical protein
MRPQGVFAEAANGMSFKIQQNFTHNPADVLKAIAQPAASNAGSGNISAGGCIRLLAKIVLLKSRYYSVMRNTLLEFSHTVCSTISEVSSRKLLR